MQRLNTVNVIEYFDDAVQSLVAYPATEEGNAAAEALFNKCAKDNKFSDEDIAEADGCLSHSDRDYQLMLVHSV
jgi:hypothetical protein